MNRTYAREFLKLEATDTTGTRRLGSTYIHLFSIIAVSPHECGSLITLQGPIQAHIKETPERVMKMMADLDIDGDTA